MIRLFICLLISISFNCLSAASVPEEARKEYAKKFHEAFILQSTGNTRKAFYHFKQASQMAQKAGESTQKLRLLNELFVWYRKYGYSLGVMSTPSGCSDEYQSEDQPRRVSAFHLPSLFVPLARIPDYHSEFGNTPEQAAQVREFLFAIGETVSGIFCITLSGGIIYGTGFTLVIDGAKRMFFILSNMWTQHERSLLELKKWETKAIQESRQNFSDSN